MRYDEIAATFHARLLNPDHESPASLRDLVRQSKVIHPDWNVGQVLAWLEEHGHIAYLVAQGRLPEDYRDNLLTLIMATIAGSAAPQAAPEPPRRPEMDETTAPVGIPAHLARPSKGIEDLELNDRIQLYSAITGKREDATVVEAPVPGSSDSMWSVAISYDRPIPNRSILWRVKGEPIAMAPTSKAVHELEAGDRILVPQGSAPDSTVWKATVASAPRHATPGVWTVNLTYDDAGDSTMWRTADTRFELVPPPPAVKPEPLADLLRKAGVSDPWDAMPEARALLGFGSELRDVLPAWALAPLPEVVGPLAQEMHRPVGAGRFDLLDVAQAVRLWLSGPVLAFARSYDVHHIASTLRNLAWNEQRLQEDGTVDDMVTYRAALTTAIEEAAHHATPETAIAAFGVFRKLLTNP